MSSGKISASHTKQKEETKGGSSSEPTRIGVALLGNPNTGKSTVFTALVGVHQRVGNYPGVTVEEKRGYFRDGTRGYEVVDLPGLYSLSPRSPDEMVAVDVVLSRRPELQPVRAIICLVDASNLERHLFLVSQVLELGLPTVIALNMFDIARAQGLRIESGKLAARLGVPVVPMEAHRRRGLGELKRALAAVLSEGNSRPAFSPLPLPIQQEVDWLEKRYKAAAESLAELPAKPRGKFSFYPPLARYLIERLLVDAEGYLGQTILPQCPASFVEDLRLARERLEGLGIDLASAEVNSRFAWVQQVLDGVLHRPKERVITWTDRLDAILTHRFWGLIIFLLVMVVLFQTVFQGAQPFTDAIQWLVGWLALQVTTILPPGALQSLLVDGVLSGVGSVISFLPQILILFFFIGILEDWGYLARAAYLMDRWLSRIGLSGKSFIPLLCSFSCAVPGIMATRVIEQPGDRLTTILVAPLMTCSARLPVYTLLIAAFIPADKSFLGGFINLQGLVLLGLYLLGITAAVCVAMALKGTVFAGRTPPFLMELPHYKWPSPQTVLLRMAERGWVFVKTAGTIILAVAIVVWAALYYPRNSEAVEKDPAVIKLKTELGQISSDDPRYGELQGELEKAIVSGYQRQSFLGRFGQLIEPVFWPLGWDWRIGCAVIASFPAREVVVATMGVIFQLGEVEELESLESGEQLDYLRAKLAEARWEQTGQPLFNIPVALSIMVFFAFCAQCAATLAVIRRETNSWRWPVFTFVYMTTLAYVAAMITYQLGIVLLGEG